MSIIFVKENLFKLYCADYMLYVMNKFLHAILNESMPWFKPIQSEKVIKHIHLPLCSSLPNIERCLTTCICMVKDQLQPLN
jgi:hypothetical protein